MKNICITNWTESELNYIIITIITCAISPHVHISYRIYVRLMIESWDRSGQTFALFRRYKTLMYISRSQLLPLKRCSVASYKRAISPPRQRYVRPPPPSGRWDQCFYMFTCLLWRQWWTTPSVVRLLLLLLLMMMMMMRNAIAQAAPRWNICVAQSGGQYF